MTSPRPVWKRPPIIAAASVLVIAGIALGVWLIKPLLVDKVVDEAFPVETASSEVVNSTMPVTGDSTVPMVEETEPLPPADPVSLRSGSFEGTDDFHMGSGQATVYELASGRQVLRFESFDVTNGPDLHVIVVPVPKVASGDDVHVDGYIDLGELKGNQGDQNYDLPGSLDLSSGSWTVVIYCDPFSVVFATASLDG